MKKLLILLLSLSLVLVAIASCTPKCTEHADSDKDGKCDTCQAEVPIDCEGEHIDADSDKVCDRCNEILIDTSVKEATVSFTVTDQDGAPLPGVGIGLAMRSGSATYSATADELGAFSLKLAVGSYNVSFALELIDGYYVADTTVITVNEDTTAIELKVLNNTPNGSESRPFSLIYGENELSIPASTTYYYVVYRSVGLLLDLKAEGISVTYNENVYTPEAGLVHLELAGEDTNSVELVKIENTTSEAVTARAELNSRPGTQGNPHAVEDISAPISAGMLTKENIVYYTYTASARGTLTLTLSGDKTYAAMLNKSNSVVVNTLDASVIEITVNAGDVISIDVTATTDKDEPVEVVFSLEFVSDPGLETPIAPI